MRDDGTIDDQYAHEGTTGRSDDTLSSDRTGALRSPASASRLGILAHRSRTQLRQLHNLTASGRVRVALATGVVCCLGLTTFAQFRDDIAGGATRVDASSGQADLAQRAQQEVASRSLERVPAAAASPTAQPTPSAANPATTATVKPKKKAKPRPVDPAPVAGLDQVQMNNAKAIVRAGRDMGVPRRALVIAVATAMQESNLYNFASGVLPESQNYPHQAVGWDHDSVGLFQQRSSSGWGPVGSLMDPGFAARQFLSALLAVPGWEDLPLTVAAQTVQVSAYPDLYAQHEWAATEVVDAFLGAGM
ncbi:peptidase M23 [Micromonospora sp. ATA32]|nr:peptidase M23 [Micromonospora sp. ATA32]